MIEKITGWLLIALTFVFLGFMFISGYGLLRKVNTPTKSVEDWAIHYALEEHLENYEDDLYVTYRVRSYDRVLGNFDGDITYVFIIIFENEEHEYTSYGVLMSYDSGRSGTNIHITERDIKHLEVTFRQRWG